MSLRQSASVPPNLLWRRPFRNLALIWIAVSVALSGLGPINPRSGLPVPQLLGYWLTVLGVAIALGAGLRQVALRLVGRGRRPWVVDALLVPAFVLLYTPALHRFNQLVFGATAQLSLAETGLLVAGLVLVVVLTREAFGLHAPGVNVWRPLEPVPASEPEAEPPTGAPDPAMPAAPATAEIDEPVPLLRRLPAPMRGEIHVVSSANHYVDVRTVRGVTSLLLRFSDALDELGETPGLQIHRSHWVADRAVAHLRRAGNRLYVVLSCGNELPVSRTHARAVRLRWGGPDEA